MPFITFIYKVGSNPTNYYGKYITDYVPHRHEGLDQIVRNELVKGINNFRKQKRLQELKDSKILIGVLSFCPDSNGQSTKNEAKCFDFYRDNNGKTHFNIDCVFGTYSVSPDTEEDSDDSYDDLSKINN